MLTNLVDATLGDDAAAIAEARDAVRDAVGQAGLIDTAAVMATFQKMDRFADATGISLDAPTEMASRKLRAEIGVDSFESARNTPPLGRLQQVAAGVAERLAPVAIRLFARVQRRIAPT